MEAQLAERDQRLSTLLGTTAVLDADLARLREEVAAAKLANAATPDTHDYSEAETRDYFIDLLLKEAGWQLDPKKNFEIEVNEGLRFVAVNLLFVGAHGQDLRARWKGPAGGRPEPKSGPDSSPETRPSTLRRGRIFEPAGRDCLWPT